MIQESAAYYSYSSLIILQQNQITWHPSGLGMVVATGYLGGRRSIGASPLHRGGGSHSTETHA
jgi:hypothetical protein